MKSVSFTIDTKEVQAHSPVKLSKLESIKILSMVENDGILWQGIEDSINAALKIVLLDRK